MSVHVAPALFVAIALTQDPSAPAIDSGVAAELSRLEKEWNAAHVRGDAAVLDRLWADDFVATVPNMPRWNKAQTMQVWRSGRMKFKSYDTSGVEIRTYGHTAVVTGQLHRTRVLGARAIDDNWQFTKVYVRGPQGWKVVAFHASDAPPKSRPNGP